MRSYAKFSPRFWTGETGKAIRQLGADAQALASYLITCEQSNMIGLYYLPIPNITHHVAISTERCVELLDAFARLDFVHYDYHKEFIWVTTAAGWQLLSDDEDGLKPRDKRVKGVRNLLRQLKRQGAPFLDLFRARYDTQLCLSEEAEKAAEQKLARPSEAPPKPGAVSGEGAGEGKRKVVKESAAADPPGRADPPPPKTAMQQIPLPSLPIAVGHLASSHCDGCEDEERNYRQQHWLQIGIYHGDDQLMEHLQRYHPQGEGNGLNQRIIDWTQQYRGRIRPHDMQRGEDHVSI